MRAFTVMSQPQDVEDDGGAIDRRASEQAALASSPTAVSNILEIELVARPPSEAQRLLALEGVEREAGDALRGAACRTLLRSQPNQALDDLLATLDRAAPVSRCASGFFVLPARERLVARLRSRVLGREATVSASEVVLLARLAGSLDSGAGAASFGGLDPVSVEGRESHRAVERQGSAIAHHLLDGLLPKTPAARLQTLRALLELAHRGKRWVDLDLVRRPGLHEAFLSLTVQEQATAARLLTRGPDKHRLLLTLLAGPGTRGCSGPEAVLRRVALEALRELGTDGVEATRLFVRDELALADPRVDATSLAFLSPDERRALQPRILARVRTATCEATSIALAEVIGEDATADIASDVAGAVGLAPLRARGGLLACLRRADPARIDLAWSGVAIDADTLRRITEPPWDGLQVVFEKRAIEALDDPDLEVARLGASRLGQLGSAAAQEPLWRRLRALHAAWATRRDDLIEDPVTRRPHFPELGLEYGLIQALGFGRAWTLDGPALGRLRALCLSRDCEARLGNAPRPVP